MATSRGFSARRNGGAPAINASPGAKPLGKVRRSQLISTYGIGAIIDLEMGSFMPMGLEDWDAATSLPNLTIGESRLQAQLGVSHFRLPPISEEIRGTRGRVDPLRSVPATRFPAWHECPQCNRIGKLDDPFVLEADGAQLQCLAHGNPVNTAPVRFVVACRRGHMDEFPWKWWAHRSREAGVCDRPVLELKSQGKSASLGDLYVRCRNCGAFESMGDVFMRDSVKGQGCGGFRPWLHDRQEGCAENPRVLQRGASNVHFGVVASALSIPPVSEAVFQIIEQFSLNLRALPDEAVVHVLRQLATRFGAPEESLRAAYAEKLKIEGNVTDLSDAFSRAEEYAALSTDRDDPIVGGIIPQFCNFVSEPPAGLTEWFDKVGAVSRLREVRALAGFTRIEPYPVSVEGIPAAIRDGHVARLSKTHKDWLPGAEIRGEGLFLRFRTEAIDTWLTENPAIDARVKALNKCAADIAEERERKQVYPITARLLLVHSFAHALIRTISIDCGYSSSALRERLYVSDATDQRSAMNGVLIYTGSPDSEGSLGGLVQLADPDKLERIIERTLSSMRWCGSDPVCLETDPVQSGDRISGAACHCCLLVPETACEKFNRELDRAILVGSPEGIKGPSWKGFFDKYVD
ncbi:DUF1998 domain-containing protein [Burkholderia stagnalis]|uniref:DUF1998 domain-containing protein n=1 Tax=Burkholderia stagnalis TaxID=1503054 RepID=UPI001C89B9EB|nr:DUF1998 domain-containing protein [Burkholderia stagnalis]